MAEPDDKIIIKKIIAGEINALQELINRYKYQGFNLAYRICRNRENAEEILQDVFINIYSNLDKYNFTGKFSTWFYRIVYNQSISYIRKKKKVNFSLNEFEDILEPIDEEKTIEEILVNSETIKYLDQAMNELSPDESAILHLYYFEEKKVSFIAEITGFTETTVKTRLFRTRKKLYSILKRLLKKEFSDFYG
ncbi:MAG: sigma-70 family RNA polymerase sigma factor [Bacteroidota bacterium]